ncbi:RNA degradosome polyphosphate kinase [Salisediminibacterium halotolerans]|uniref:RNA degradosome polyphosphate kinase n=1 Tax=Salisediminibacterium halotolerans TaxID=517425 RepID=UPI000EB3AC1E|nr:RNA degradosome polyphosphate kinase [Salisediminibacterium halotolerans]RLJ71655.1 polyphosphate kinase [Actinophytocola xinjiangensis]RPE86805.1 polyphosphate kinase [Salisediminibacterium halotolerans]TWG32868.1 polyphosphate kinase [Salisediminibacterium halotolerans]GEL06960.1 polyphosphate kinase [Salisediminibacterium halotolerans]
MSTNKTIQELDNPQFFNNRELSWLAFNQRVLEEALDEHNPLFERLKFLAIASSNLDEFFMVRVAGLKDQVKARFNKPENKAGMTPKQQLANISEINHEIVAQQNKAFQLMKGELETEGISLLTMNDLTTEEIKRFENYFMEEVYPVLTPMAVDAYRPFPMLLNKSINLAAVIRDLQHPDETAKAAIVQVPSVLDRFVQVGHESKYQYILLEDIIGHFLGKLFKGHEVESITEFRITRNADMTIHEEGARDLLKEIEKELKNRKWGAAVRLEVRDGKYDQKMIGFLLEVLEIHRGDLYIADGPLDLTFLFLFYKQFEEVKDELYYKTLMPQPPRDLDEEDDIFTAVSERDLFFHHPYESFEPIVDFVAQAGEDPHVLAIKQTLYRVSGDSPIIEALKRAAENGKQVTVLLELKARFDEENNVQWAKELEKAGCHVIYGMTHLKTHSKITLVVRKKNEKIERFVHLGTGNYNDQTASLYTDMGILTSKRKFGIDATDFFNYLSGFTEKPRFHHLSMAPFDIRSDFIRYLNNEIRFQKQHQNGRIIAKMNSLTDKDIIIKLYEASQAGVKIDLIVRGVCCLRPGIQGVSENIRVFSIVGRYLEHSRIYYFHHNGDERIFLSSADLMTRNMVKRVELLFPIYEPAIKSRLQTILTVMLNDNVKAREQKSDGSYQYVQPNNNGKRVNSQMALYEMAYRLLEDEE